MFLRSLILLLLMMLPIVSGCSSTATTADIESPDLSETKDTGPQAEPDSKIPDQQAQPGPLQTYFSLFGPVPDDGPIVFVEHTKVNGPDIVSMFVKARNLGMIAGVAFYIEYDPELLELYISDNKVDFGDGSGPYFTVDIVKEIEPGVITFGVARFCKSKIPWGSTDQCGGVQLDEEAPLLALTFKLKQKGSTPVRFPASHTLIRRPDRSPVEPVWIGGKLDVYRTEVAK